MRTVVIIFGQRMTAEAGGIGNQLKYVREKRGLSVRGAAEIADGGLSREGLSSIERGRNAPTLRTLQVLTRVYGIVITITAREIIIEDDG